MVIASLFTCCYHFLAMAISLVEIFWITFLCKSLGFVIDFESLKHQNPNVIVIPFSFGTHEAHCHMASFFRQVEKWFHIHESMLGAASQASWRIAPATSAKVGHAIFSRSLFIFKKNEIAINLCQELLGGRWMPRGHTGAAILVVPLTTTTGWLVMAMPVCL